MSREELDPATHGFLGLIRALEIFRAAEPTKLFPTHCEHDELTVDVSPDKVPEEMLPVLEKLGFEPDHENERFYSFRFGSC